MDSAYLAKAGSVVVESEDLILGAMSTLVDVDLAVLVLVDVVTEVKLVDVNQSS